MKQHYIRLLTNKVLNNKQQNIWFKVVDKFLDNDNIANDSDIMKLTAGVEIEGDDDFPHVYIVYISSDINIITTKHIVKLWGKIYPYDFEIETSSELDLCSDCDIEIDKTMHEEIQQQASKFLHNRWVENQVQTGWRYGMYLNENEKTNPKLRDWDSLNEQYRTTFEMTAEQAVTFLKEYSHLFV